jgi:transcription elongation factor GreA
MKGIYLTKEGIEKLQQELKQLIEVDRKEIIKKIKETREFGDLSENAEYDEARNQQSIIEGRIEELEAILKNARVIDGGVAKGNGNIGLGSRVQVQIESMNQEFTLVSSAEADPAAGLISNESPLGKALVGAKVGDSVTVEIPDGGTVEYKILAVH